MSVFRISTTHVCSYFKYLSLLCTNAKQGSAGFGRLLVFRFLGRRLSEFWIRDCGGQLSIMSARDVCLADYQQQSDIGTQLPRPDRVYGWECIGNDYRKYHFKLLSPFGIFGFHGESLSRVHQNRHRDESLFTEKGITGWCVVLVRSVLFLEFHHRITDRLWSTRIGSFYGTL